MLPVSQGQLGGGGSGTALFCQHRQWPSAPAPSASLALYGWSGNQSRRPLKAEELLGRLLWVLPLLHFRLSSSKNRAAVLKSQCCLLDLLRSWSPASNTGASWAWEA